MERLDPIPNPNERMADIGGQDRRHERLSVGVYVRSGFLARERRSRRLKLSLKDREAKHTHAHQPDPPP